MGKWALWAIVGCVIVLAGCSPKNAATSAAGDNETSAGVTFAKDIKPILEERCGKCHVEDKKGNFSLASLEAAMSGGKSGVEIVPGDGSGSRLYQMASGQPGVKKMPPRGQGLSEAQLATIKSWIDGGAH